MGLDVSHDCWSGPYSAFSRWRVALAEAAGWHLEVHKDEGWPLPYPWPREVNADGLADENYQGVWESIPEDPLVVLWAHSDCSGVLPVAALIPLAERLEGLVDRFDADVGKHPEWQPGDEQRATYGGYRAATVHFAAGLRRAAAANEEVRFG